MTNDFDEIQKEIDRDRKVDRFKELCLYLLLLSLWIFGVILLCKEIMRILMMVRYF